MNKKSIQIITAGIAILIACIIISLLIGRYSITPKELMQILCGKTGENISASATVLLNVRIPRVAAAVIIGGALSVSGAAYQGIFRNPMVSPDILGASAGSGFGAALAILLGLNAAAIQGAAFGMGITAVAVSMLMSSKISKRTGNSILILVLTGMVVSSLFSAFISIIKYAADPYDTLPAITFWLMGGLSYITYYDAIILCITVIIGAIPIILLRWRINLMTFGEDEASSLGVNVKLVRIIVIFSATLLTSASVAAGGMIGWIGLIVPHIARMISGPNYRMLIPTSFLTGCIFLLIVDDIARTLFAQEIPLGILTAILGAPLFMYLLYFGKRGYLN